MSEVLETLLIRSLLGLMGSLLLLMAAVAYVLLVLAGVIPLP